MVTKQRGSSGEEDTLREGFRGFRSKFLLRLDVSREGIEVYRERRGEDTRGGEEGSGGEKSSGGGERRGAEGEEERSGEGESREGGE